MCDLRPETTVLTVRDRHFFLCPAGRVRELLWECDAFPVYMRLLQDGSWYVDVLQCLLKWRRLDSARMDAEMEKSAEYLVDVFSFCGKPGFRKALEPPPSIGQVPRLFDLLALPCN